MKIIFSLLFIFTSFCTFADDFCSDISSKSEADRAIISSDESGYKATGKGRVYFHSAPNDQCVIKDLFIIPGDLVNASADYDGFTYVIYFTKNGKDVEGWVKSDRLISTGTGIGPSEK